MLDPQDEFYDRRLATHLVSLYHQTQEEEEEEFLVSKTRFFFYFSVVVFCTIWGISLGGGRGGTLGISGWGCATGTLEPLTYTRASSAEFCYPILE